MISYQLSNVLFYLFIIYAYYFLVFENWDCQIGCNRCQLHYWSLIDVTPKQMMTSELTTQISIQFTAIGTIHTPVLAQIIIIKRVLVQTTLHNSSFEKGKSQCGWG